MHPTEVILFILGQISPTFLIYQKTKVLNQILPQPAGGRVFNPLPLPPLATEQLDVYDIIHSRTWDETLCDSWLHT